MVKRVANLCDAFVRSDAKPFIKYLMFLFYLYINVNNAKDEKIK